jgi:hypothetical protein
MSNAKTFTAAFHTAGGTILWQEAVIATNRREAAQEAIRRADDEDLYPSDGSAPAATVTVFDDTDDGTEWDIEGSENPFAPLP